MLRAKEALILIALLLAGATIADSFIPQSCKDGSTRCNPGAK